METLEAAQEWGKAPWEIDGLALTPWRRYLWRERRRVYTAEMLKKRKRDAEEVEMRRTRR